MSTLLEVDHLTVDYPTGESAVRAVDDVSFSIQPGEIIGLAGESGCGKSTTAHAILGILKPPATVANGRVLFEGKDLLGMSPAELRTFRWRHVSLVFQSAMNALNPVLSIGDQFVDMIQAHMRVSKREARKRAAELLELVGIEPSRIKSF